MDCIHIIFMSAKKSKIKIGIVVAMLTFFAFLVRLYGLNWDQSQHLHPDERFLTMVLNDIKLPNSLRQYLSTSESPLNPYNYPQFQFFVYGTFPIFFVKFISAIFHQDTYSHVFLWGRGFSAVFDSLIVSLLFLIANKTFKKRGLLLFLPSVLYTFCVLPIQLSHFYAVDTFLNFFLVATFTALVYDLFPVAAIFFGLALSSKVTALYFVPVILIFLIRKRRPVQILKSGLWFIISVVIFRFFQPYAFTGLYQLNQQFVGSLKSLNTYNNRDTWYPPGVQWLSKTPLLFSLKNLLFWGCGLPLSFIFLLSVIKTNLRKIDHIIVISLIWITYLYFYQGSQLVQTLRYFIIIMPFICLVAGHFAQNLNRHLLATLIACHLIFGIMFLSIYSRPHSRVQASEWIYQHLPVGSTVTGEYWDDLLPLYLSSWVGNRLHILTLDLYAPDTPEKWQELDKQLQEADYIIMSSNRLWGSIPLVPSRYPLASKFYKDLFSENLNFSKLIEVNSYPGFSLPFLGKCYYFAPTNFPGIKNSWFAIDSQCLYPGVYLRDDTAEEVFTVYDHPKVLIFQKKSNVKQ